MGIRRLRAFPFAAALATIVAAPVACQVPRDTIDVLYVGNSYIYFNNLPGIVEGISTALSGPIVRGMGHTHGGATLRRHVEDGHLTEIFTQDTNWDWIILQEQSTLGASYDPASGELGSPEAFHEATRELVRMIRAEQAKPALYMTWAKEAFPTQSAALSRAYRTIGSELGIPVAHVGEAFAEVLQVRPEFSLYTSDGSHPNAAGSYLAACVIYALVAGRNPVGAPREILGAPWDVAGPVESSQPTILVSLSARDAEFLQRIAWKVTGAGTNSET